MDGENPPVQIARPIVYVIDDDPEIQRLLRRVFALENCEVKVFSDARSALNELGGLSQNESAGKSRNQLVICDFGLPDIDGLKVFEILQQRKSNLPVVFITAQNSVEIAVSALKKGAYDYLVKPINPLQLTHVVARAFEEQRTKMERVLATQALGKRERTSIKPGGEVLGNSPKMAQVLALAKKVAQSDSNILITGESGTGKEMIARFIHQSAHRSGFPFVAINCSAIPDHLLESELFGFKKGAFTGATESRIGLFEEAEGGTVFLDEIGDMPLTLQAKILRVLQEKRVRPLGDNHTRETDVRIIAATHKDLWELVREGLFREDLFYRLCVIPIQIPSLAERREDIPLMASFFVRKHCERTGVPLKIVTESAMKKLMTFRWPGNVRQLENTLERAVVLSSEKWIDERDIDLPEDPVPTKRQPIFGEMLTLEELERSYIQYVLEVNSYAKEKSAEILGIDRKTLYRKQIKYGIPDDCEAPNGI